MFQWRLKLREAGQALSAGRVDEAREVLSDENLREFLPAKRLAGEVGEKFTERARQRFAWGESAAGMADLEAADELGALGTDAIRHEYAHTAAQQARGRLTVGDPEGALKRVERALRRGAIAEDLRAVKELAELWIKSRQFADAGEMASAADRLERTHRLAAMLDAQAVAPKGTIKPTATVGEAVATERQKLTQRATQHAAARERLQAASTRQAWDDALAAVEESLHLAPADPIALGLRRRLWKEVGLGLTQPGGGHRRHTPIVVQDHAMNHRPGHELGNRRLGKALREDIPTKSTRRSKQKAEDTGIGLVETNRRMLWIDAVGGFLVCLDNEVLLGQPAGSDGGATIGILADISRRHAVLRREAGAYVLQPLGPVRVDGQPIAGPTVLGDNALIELGPSLESQGGVRIRFTRPHALSATARLVIESGHRTSPGADAVLLMADSCVLGPGKHSHVRCANWKEDVIVFRKPTNEGDSLQCRSSAPLVVNGESVTGPATISPGARVEGEEFAMSVEEV